MLSFEASYFYLLAVGITLVNFFKKIYFTTSYYNQSLRTKLPEQLYFYPNPYLLSSFVNQKNFAIKLSRINIDKFWMWFKNSKEEENFNNFFWLNLINRKNNGAVIQKIISIWIDNNTRYNKNNWHN